MTTVSLYGRAHNGIVAILSKEPIGQRLYDIDMY